MFLIWFRFIPPPSPSTQTCIQPWYLVFTLLAQEQLIYHKYASFLFFCDTFYPKIQFFLPLNHWFSPIQGIDSNEEHIPGGNIIFKKRSEELMILNKTCTLFKPVFSVMASCGVLKDSYKLSSQLFSSTSVILSETK